MVDWLIPLAYVATYYLWMLLVIVLHETSHLVAAKLVGFTPFSMKIGTGPLLFGGTIFGIDVQIRLWPLYGMAYANRLTMKGLRWKGAIYALSGPISDIILLTILCTVIIPALMKVEPPSVWATAGFILALGQVAMLLSSLYPRDVRIEGRLLPSDAKLFLSYISGTVSKTIADTSALYQMSIARYDDTFDVERSWLLNADSASLMILTEAGEDHARNHFEAAAEKYLQVLESNNMTKGERAMFLDCLASIPIIGNDVRFLDRAMEWAEQAYALCPDAPTIRGTLGSLLVEKGSCGKGIEMLEPLTQPGNELIDQSISACYLAKAYGKQGRPDEAHRWLNFAREIKGSPAICEKIARELTPA